MVAANMEATEPRVPIGWAEFITLNVLRSAPWLGKPLWCICVTNDHWYVSLVVITIQSFPHLWLFTGFVTRVTWQVPHVEQELLTLQEHLNSPKSFRWGRVARYLMSCFVDRCLFFFLLIIVLFVNLITVSDFPFGICKVSGMSHKMIPLLP